MAYDISNLQKLKVYYQDDSVWHLVLDCSAQYNPEKLQYSKRANWNTEKSTSSNIGTTTFGGGDPIALSVDFFFDTSENGTDVREYSDPLVSLAGIMSITTTVTKHTYLSNKEKLKKGIAVWKKVIKDTTQETVTQEIPPPKCKVEWGTFSFICITESVDVTFTMFKPDGTPVRATVKVKFRQIEDMTLIPPQNPTSRSIARRVWVVEAGQTLNWIAYREYGDPARWREIAAKNNLDNPLDLQPGQVLDL
jgi:hypothetical protein